MFPASESRSRRSLLAGLMLAVASSVSAAQQAPPEEPPPPPENGLEEYLADRNLRDLLVTHLLRRVRASEGPERAQLGERLGSLYVQMLNEATTPAHRQTWEARALELIQSVPEAESVELRLTLAKARYLQAEEIAERFRIRLATPEERREAETILRSVGVTLQAIATSMHRRVELLERREAVGRDDEAAAIRNELADARRLRSLAMYYAGWTAYYNGLLTQRSQLADEAIQHFGWLLNGSGKPANVESVSPDMLRYEHVARAAIGCALSESLRGRDGAALLWLHTLDSSPNLPEAVKRQLLTRRFIVLAEGKRWADLDLLVRRRRMPERTGTIKPLAAPEARLLAVLMLESLQNPRVPPAAHEPIRALADAAITDLITLGEARHVHDLVSRYGSGLLSGEGFIVQYVRGLHAYERARQAHAEGENDQEPTARAEVANLYSAAAQTLDNAAAAGDAEGFPGEQASATMLGALCLFYSGSLEEAANRFEEAHRLASAQGGGEDSLWMAIVALDKAVDAGRPSLKPRRERLATLYLRRFPAGDRAAMLLLRMSGDGLIAPERAAEILLAIGRESPLYGAARRHAADLLYSIYRRARGAERDFAALRFAEITDEILQQDLSQLDGSTSEGRQTAERAILRLRQVLDAVLGMAAPDLERADRAIEQIQTLEKRAGLDLRAVQDEITFRRLQIAMMRGRQEDLDRHLVRLHDLGGRFADSADRLLYQRAVTALRRQRTEANAQSVVRHGLRVVTQFSTGASALSDPSVQNLYNTVADAAAFLWETSGDRAQRETAIRLDRAMVELANPPAVVLRRFAQLVEADGDAGAALGAWRSLLSGLQSGSPEWIEARYHSLRLLADEDPGRAREVLTQFKVLHPDLGKEPWATRFRELERTLTPSQPGPDDQSAAPAPEKSP
jgi:hypothetical protein